MSIKAFTRQLRWLLLLPMVFFNCYGSNNNRFANDANVIATAKIILTKYKNNQLTTNKNVGSVQNLIFNELKKIYLNGKSYEFMIYAFFLKDWKDLKKTSMFYFINIKNNGVLEDFFKLYGFVEDEIIGNYNYKKQYFSIDIPKNFFQGQNFFNIKYFNMNAVKRKVVFSFFPSIDDQYKSTVDYQGSDKIAIKEKKAVDTLKQWWSLFNKKQWDEKKINAIVDQWNLKYLGSANNYNVYQIVSDNPDSLMLLMVNQTNNYITILIETKTKRTFRDSYFYNVFTEINNKNKYQ